MFAVSERLKMSVDKLNLYDETFTMKNFAMVMFDPTLSLASTLGNCHTGSTIILGKSVLIWAQNLFFKK